MSLDPIHGCSVRACYNGRELVCVKLGWRDLSISVYGDEYFNLDVGEELGFVGAIYMREWRIVQQLARASVIDRLIAVYQHYAFPLGGTQCERCGVTLLPDDGDQICQGCRERRWQERFGRLGIAISYQRAA